MNPYFKRPPQSALYDPESLEEVKARYQENKGAFVSGLVDHEHLETARFEAMLLWFGEVVRFTEANDLPLPGDTFDDFDTITRYLSTLAHYSSTQGPDFQAAVVRWARFLKSLGFDAPAAE